MPFSVQDTAFESECLTSLEQDFWSVVLILIVCEFQCQLIGTLFRFLAHNFNMYVYKGGGNTNLDFFFQLLEKEMSEVWNLAASKHSEQNFKQEI